MNPKERKLRAQLGELKLERNGLWKKAGLGQDGPREWRRLERIFKLIQDTGNAIGHLRRSG